jgi:hypothetical protein
MGLMILGFTAERKKGDKPTRLVDSAAMLLTSEGLEVDVAMMHKSTRQDPPTSAMGNLATLIQRPLVIGWESTPSAGTW